MTYGVFLIYSKENYPPAAFEAVFKEVDQLIFQRGFTKMKLFSEQLLKVSDEHRGQKIDGWYRDFLKAFE